MRLLFLVALLPALQAQPRTSLDLLEQRTIERLRAIDAQGSFGVYARDLATGRTISHNGDAVFPLASTIKIAILIEMFRASEEGKFKLTDSITLQPSDRAGGSGYLQHLLKDKPYTLTARELITAMIQVSDNIATNKCIGMVGMDAINSVLKEYGATSTKLQRKMLDSAAAAKDLENVGTPSEMAALIERIYRGKAVSESASRQMMEILQLVDGDVRRAVPASVRVAAKTGELPGARLETAIVRLDRHPYVVSIASAFLDRGANPVPEAARIIHEHFDKLEHSNIYGNRVR